jgi:hypothetical protein
VASNNADTRKRKWWLYAKLDALTQWAEENKGQTVHGHPLHVFVGIDLKPTKRTFKVWLFGNAGHLEREERKRALRVELARAYWMSHMVDAKTKEDKAATAEVREFTDKRGMTMIAVWNGPKDEAKTEPTW